MPVPEWSNRTFGWIFAIAGTLGSIWFLAYVGYKPGPSFEGAWTRWLPTVGSAVLGLFALFASLTSLRNRRWAAILTLVPSTAIFLLWAAETRQFDKPGQLLRMTPVGKWLEDAWLAFPVLLIPGLFWLFTRRAQPTMAKPPHTFRKIAGPVLLLASVPLASVLMSVCLVGEDNWFRDLCGYPPPFTAPKGERNSVFTGRVLRSFRSPKLGLELMEEHGALVRVEKGFWGLPRWHRTLAIVLVSTSADWDPFRAGEMYFVDADRLDGALTRFLPIFRDHRCTRTAPIKDAEIELRVLRDGLPSSGLRILGQTIRLRQQSNSNYYSVEKVPHVNVTIEGWRPRAQFSAISDENGVYDLSGLPLAGYRVGTADETGKMHWENYCCNPDGPRHSICECTVYVH